MTRERGITMNYETIKDQAKVAQFMSLLQDQSAEYFVAFLAGIKSVLPMEEVLNLKQQDFYFDDGEVKLFNKITNEDGRTTMVYWGAMLDELNMYREWLEARSPRPVWRLQGHGQHVPGTGSFSQPTAVL